MSDEVLSYEKAYLGSVIQRADALQEYRLAPSDFSVPFNQKVMRAILDVEQEGATPDIVVVGAKFHGGDKARIAELTDAFSSNVKFYYEQVREASRRRRLRLLGQKLVEQSVAQDSEQTLQDIEQALLEIHSDTHAGYAPIGDFVHDAISAIEAAYNRKGALSGLPTGFSLLNAYTDGFQPEEVVIVGARPGTGKTAISLNMVHAMTHAGHSVGFFTAEMSGRQLVQRLMSSLSGIAHEKLRSGMLTQSEFKGLQEAAETIYNKRVCVNETPNIKLPDLLNEARRMRRRNDIEAVFIDYMSLVTHPKADLPRHEQVADVSRNMKRIARELQVPVVVLSQVTRDTQSKPPTLANIRESGAIEQDADVVLFLHPSGDAANGVQPVDLIVAKNRNGPAGSTVPLMFNQKTVTFHEVQHERTT